MKSLAVFLHRVKFNKENNPAFLDWGNKLELIKKRSQGDLNPCSKDENLVS